MNEQKQVLRVGIGGPVGSGKTALVDAWCKSLRNDYQIAVVTNDIYTKEDAQFLVHSRVGASLEIMERDARKMRGERPFVFTNLKTGGGLSVIREFVLREGLLD